MRFYNRLETDISKFRNDGIVYLAGDFNARMASTGDPKPNQTATAEFKGSGLGSLTILNKLHAFGIPTYRNVTQKNGIGESIIALVLTSNPETCGSFTVHTRHLGDTAHSAHRAIEFTIRSDNVRPKPDAQYKEAWGLLRGDNQERFSNKISQAVAEIAPNISDFLETIKDSRPGDVFGHMGRLCDDFMQKIDSAKFDVLGRKKIKVGGGARIIRSRKLSKIQYRINGIVSKLSRQLTPADRAHWVDELDKLKVRKVKILKDLKRKAYVKLLDTLEKIQQGLPRMFRQQTNDRMCVIHPNRRQSRILSIG